jgi:hypothetical protein
MPLQEFTHTRKRMPDRELMIGVQKKGRITLNAGSLEALGNPAHVVLLFDPEMLELGVRAANREEPHGYELRKEPASSAKSASVLALWSYYNIDSEAYVGRYVAKQVGAMLVVSLRHKHEG